MASLGVKILLACFILFSVFIYLFYIHFFVHCEKNIVVMKICDENLWWRINSSQVKKCNSEFNTINVGRKFKNFILK